MNASTTLYTIVAIVKRWGGYLIAATLIAGCSGNETSTDSLSHDNVTQFDISSQFSIEHLTDSLYHFPAIEPNTHANSTQTLERFDLIFVGYDQEPQIPANDGLTLASIIPGTYTHMLMYIGKDSEGFAYGIEMNASENQTYSFGLDGLKMDGRLYVYCLGSDFGELACPEDDHFYGLEFYDYMQTKKLQPELKDKLMANEDAIMTTIKKDLVNAYPFQLPFRVGYETIITGIVQIVDDGRVNGADCAAYILALFEESSGVCLDNARMSASEIETYFLHDPVGQQALLPAKYNVLTDDGNDLLLSDALTKNGYSLIDNQPRNTACADGRAVFGMPVPDRIFNSPSLF